MVCPSAQASFHGIVRAVSERLTIELDALSAKVMKPAERVPEAASVEKAGLKFEAGFIPEKTEVRRSPAIQTVHQSSVVTSALKPVIVRPCPPF